jgi:hypothetical protein
MYVRKRERYMKVNLRAKKRYGGYKTGQNVVVYCNFKNMFEQYQWIKKGLIQNKEIEYAKYIQIKKELKAKGLIQ